MLGKEAVTNNPKISDTETTKVFYYTHYMPTAVQLGSLCTLFSLGHPGWESSSSVLPQQIKQEKEHWFLKLLSENDTKLCKSNDHMKLQEEAEECNSSCKQKLEGWDYLVKSNNDHCQWPMGRHA